MGALVASFRIPFIIHTCSNGCGSVMISSPVNGLDAFSLKMNVLRIL